MIEGIVTRSTGSWYTVFVDGNSFYQCRTAGKLRLDNLKATNPVAVGDSVLVLPENESEGLIKKILPRKNYVVRQSPRKKHFVHLIASNIDQAILVATIVKPDVKTGFIDRFLLMTAPYNIPVTIVFNKCDLYNEEDFLMYKYLEHVYTKIGYEVILASVKNGDGMDAIKARIKDKVSLISGQSGVGKSSIINYLIPEAELKTSEISEYNGKGQHTTTFAEMLFTPFNGKLIDTPGIKTLGFNHLEPQDIAHNFKEIFSVGQHCKFNNCLHRNEPKCAVKEALEVEEISSLRYSSYLQILDELEDQNYWERHKNI